MREFVEKPSPDEIDTNLVNAGAYILERDVLDEMASAGTRISIEREVFPQLVGHGLYGYEASGYWMDIGTPERYLQATYEILEGDVQDRGRTTAWREAGGVLREGEVDGAPGVVHAPALVGAGCRLAESAIVGSRTVLGRGVTVGAGAHIESSVVLDGAVIGAGTRISASIIGPRLRDRRPLPRRGPGGARPGREHRSAQHPVGGDPGIPRASELREGAVAF